MPGRRFALKQIEDIILRWRYNDISTDLAWDKIGKIQFEIQKKEWEDSHPSDIPGEKD